MHVQEFCLVEKNLLSAVNVGGFWNYKGEKGNFFWETGKKGFQMKFQMIYSRNFKYECAFFIW